MRCLPALGVWLSLGVALFADSPPAAWQAIRDKQPAALHLTITLPKDHFFVGEEIDAKLDFSNDDAAHPVSLCVGAGSPGAIFYAVDDKGAAAENPRQWEEEWLPQVTTGPVSLNPIGHYNLSLPVNQSLRFDHPGVYRIYAESSLIDGTSFEEKRRSEVVSIPVTVTITPIDPASEKATLDQAAKGIDKPGQNNENARLAIYRLGFLGTPAARDRLIALLADPKLGGFAEDALYYVPNPHEVADRIFDAASHGKIILDDNGGLFYATLAAADIVRGTPVFSLSEAKREKLFQKFWKMRDEARGRLMQAQLAGTVGNAPAHLDALWAAFRNEAVHHDPSLSTDDLGPARDALLPHQLELPERDVTQILEDWPYWGLEGFLPLVKREAAPPHNQLIALIAWAELDPGGARPAIIREFEAHDSRFMEGNYSVSMLLPAVKPMPLPQFDSLFREKLAASNGYAFPIIPVICAFGSPGLLPDVIKNYDTYHKDSKNGWDFGIQTCLFHYWLRCDPEGGSAALEREIESGGREGSGLLTEVLRHWPTKNARPVLKWALENPQPALVSEGLFLVERNGDDSWNDAVLAALDRINTDKGNRRDASYESRRYLDNAAFHFTDDQRKRLQAMAAEVHE